MAAAYWNHGWVKAPTALTRLPQLPSGETDWGDVRIAHLDTGYTQHEAFGDWPPNGRNGTILTQLGKDYLKPSRPNARDPLTKGALKHPGHGTRSGSALSGDDPNVGFKGIAPKLPLLPCRVTDSSLLNRESAEAIRKAIGEIVRRRRAKVINISLGQLFPYRDIGEAVDLAYENGVIVVCAAGQLVDRVVYPAKHRRAIAVAGVTRNKRRFAIYQKYDSYARIDAWAPADPITRGDFPDKTTYGEGDGTTYAALHVSAAAAMWLRLHGRAIDSKYGNSWKRVEAFRALLRASQGRLPFRTPPSNYAGRLNIDKLLGLSLPAAAGLREEPDRAADDKG